jgi:UDP-glucose 4-epimerase
MKCLITGVNGVVGKNLSKLLIEKYGFDIWGCGRTPSDDSQYFTLDLIDRAAVLDLFSTNSFDCVIHCAANINNDVPFEMFSNNLNSTLNVVEASLDSGVKKLFHTSGVPVIGEILELPITEEHPTNPSTTYHLSKLQSEQIVEQYCKGKIDFINMRIPSPVGRNMPLRSIFPIFLEKIKNDETITLTGDSRRKQNFLDIRDLASFIHKSSLVDGVSGVFNVAAEKPYSNLELAEAIISRTGSKSKIINDMVESTSTLQSWDVSIMKAKEHFGYVAEHDIYETINWVL